MYVGYSAPSLFPAQESDLDSKYPVRHGHGLWAAAGICDVSPTQGRDSCCCRDLRAEPTGEVLSKSSNPFDKAEIWALPQSPH